MSFLSDAVSALKSNGASRLVDGLLHFINNLGVGDTLHQIIVDYGQKGGVITEQFVHDELDKILNGMISNTTLPHWEHYAAEAIQMAIDNPPIWREIWGELQKVLPVRPAPPAATP